MSEVGEISQVMSVMINGSQVACSITKDFFILLKRLTQILFNLPEAWVSRKLKKDSGHAKLKYLQMKDNVHSYILSDDCYIFLKKNAKKYNVQWADSPIVRKDRKNRIFVAANDLVQFKALLEDYEKVTGKKLSDSCQEQTLQDYMIDSGLAKCTDEEFKDAMIKSFGKNYKNISEADLLKSDMSAEKKNEIVDILKFNQLDKLISNENNVSYNFNLSDVVAEKGDKFLVPVKNSFSDYAWIDKDAIHKMPDNNKTSQSLVAIMPADKVVKVLDKISGYEKNVNLGSYFEGVDNAYSANTQNDLNTNTSGIMQYNKNELSNLVSDLLLKTEPEKDLSEKEIVVLNDLKAAIEDKNIFKFAFADVVREKGDKLLVPIKDIDKFIWIEKSHIFEVPKSNGHEFIIMPGLECNVSLTDNAGNIEKEVLLNSYLEGVNTNSDIENKINLNGREIHEKELSEELSITETETLDLDSENKSVVFDYSNAADITISEIMLNQRFTNENEIVTRIPGMYGKNIGYLRLDRKDVKTINNGKTMLSYLKFDKEYSIYDDNMNIRLKMQGKDLYTNHYDKVNKEVRKKQQRREAYMQDTQKQKHSSLKKR